MNIIAYNLENLGYKKLLSKFEKYIIFFIVLSISLGLSSMAQAESGSLTEIFSTKAFQGSWEVLNKFNWVGVTLNFLISATCLFGLVSTIGVKMVTFLYLSNRAFFDTVYDIKNEAKGSRYAGFEGLVKNVNNRFVGFDVIVGFLYSIVPNIKGYSEFNPDKMHHNLTEDDNITSYVLKTFLPTVLLVFFFSAGFNGTLAKSYGTVVGGFSAIADRVVDVNVEAYVNRLMSTGESYTFTLGSTNTESGKLAEKIARDMYGKVLSRLDIIDTETRMAVGLRIEEWAYNEILNQGHDVYQHLERLVNNTSSINSASISSEADVRAIRYELVLNTNSSAPGQAFESTRLIDLLPSNIRPAEGTVAENLTAHIILRKDRVSDADFFVRPNTND